MLLGGDEYWWNFEANVLYNPSVRIATGLQNADNPIQDFWDGEGFKSDPADQLSLFIALRDCNIFLENIHIPPDLRDEERVRWIAEVNFLKAYYHFFLLKLYGPIPIIGDINLSVSASPDEVRVRREPVDDVVEHIVKLLDKAVPDLPNSTAMTAGTEAGRITKPIALAVKAQALVWAASPLFNGNPDYANFKDNDGRQLFDPEKKVSKWKRAAEAIKIAIDSSLSVGHNLYTYPSSSMMAMSDITKVKCDIRGAVTERFNIEQVWSATYVNANDLQGYVVPPLDPNLAQNVNPSVSQTNEIHATLKMAEQFYTKNGIPLNEDSEWINWIGGNIANRYDIRKVNEDLGINGTSTVKDDHLYYIGSGSGSEETAKLHFYREPRFYASLGFDRGIWEMNGNGENSLYLKARAGEIQGKFPFQTDHHSCTGYFVKKMVNMSSSRKGNTWVPTGYSFPLIRLADLYLLYAEALNEAEDSQSARQEAYVWIDKVRERAGLKGVEESWRKSTVSGKPYSQETLREIIKQERLIELSFEGGRFWDLRRWKDAMKYLNQPVQGWDYRKADVKEFYQVITIQPATKRAFITRDYLWPIKVKNLQTNANLVQNPGWPTGLKYNQQWN
jgi:hypothetical protein